MFILPDRNSANAWLSLLSWNTHVMQEIFIKACLHLLHNGLCIQAHEAQLLADSQM